jgi:proline dehydrogenase
MLRAGLLWLSEQPRIFRFIRGNGLARRFASRFVAGETVASGVAALKDLNAAGISASLDVLGESVHNAAEAHAARDTYLAALDCIAAARANANVSLKLTQMGLDIAEELCVDNLIDMEQSDYVERTLQRFKRVFYPEFGNAVGVVLQSYLRRTEQDLEQLIALGARVRLCKGAYQEPPAVAFPAKRDVDATYVRCLERLLLKGNYPGIATHDVRIIQHAKAFARDRGVAPARFEFQMLYGVRRDLQVGLRREGYNVRVYVPFGTQWYPYLMRRLAERPANVAFLLGNVLKESLRRS